MSGGMARSISQSFVAFVLTYVAAQHPKSPPWPTKNGNSHRTGQAEHSARFNLSEPTWVWEEPDRPRTGSLEVFQTSPVLDADRNMYIGSGTGRVYALDEHGHLLWKYSSSGLIAGNLALEDGILFSAADDGFAFALVAATGNLLWRKQIGPAAPDDIYSPLVAQGLVILPACSDASDLDGNDLVVALSVDDGSQRWSYTMPKGGPKGYNFMPAEFEDSIVFPDRAGGLHRLLVADGAEVWRVPPPEGKDDTISTGGLALGPNAMAYVGSNSEPYPNFKGTGLLTAYHLEHGAKLWQETVEGPVNSAPAVGKVAGYGALVVVVALGHTPYEPGVPGHEIAGSVEARDAQTGKVLWVFRPGFFNSSACAGWTAEDKCFPDLFSNPSIGADGTVYINWSGGWAYALRDKNLDGLIDLSNHEEVSGFNHNGGTNGQTAIAPGYLVAPSCWKLYGFSGAAPGGNDQKIEDDKTLLIGIACVIVALFALAVALCYWRRKGTKTDEEDSLREASLQPRG